ncbi:MAG: Smr protein/MutS2 [Phycisphaerales bacterium]|nr:Smr protein/MutS2 [Phycisphaerales bacterium]MDB5358410.1 Smr protein/MutS2 [Phycisphaerales bacterium]
MNLLFYISGHGYGHARRMAQVIRAFSERRPDVTVWIRSTTPSHIFEPLRPECIEPCDIDVGVAECDPLTIDRETSLDRLVEFMGRRDAIVADELAVVNRLRPELIVADIPFLAGEVAARAGVPCIGISNFTWDWIYDHLFGDDRRYAAIAPVVREGYGKMEALLELPFGRTSPAIATKIAMPLIAGKSRRERADVLAQIGVAAGDRRPRVLFGTRGGLPPGALGVAARDADEFLFLCLHAPAEALPGNAMAVRLSHGLDFSDVLAVSDVVVSKLGYGIVSDCIAAGVPLVWPRREGFVEDDIVAADAPRHVGMVEMPRKDYYAGRWGRWLRKAVEAPPTYTTIRTDGAEACANYLARAIGGRE